GSGGGRGVRTPTTGRGAVSAPPSPPHFLSCDHRRAGDGKSPARLFPRAMKLKQLPEDFQVVERAAVAPGGAGDFALYRLEKRGWATPDALAEVRRRWRLDAGRVSCGGLKDKHAHTSQHFT